MIQTILFESSDQAMKIFNDYYNNEVKLSFADHPFTKHPKHVWVVCRLKNQWLLTKHKARGIEFPGGKVEEGETAEQAAKREVKEETGGEVERLVYLGQYHVTGKGESVVKNVYYAEISNLFDQDTYYETEGPVLLEQLPDNLRTKESYSFMMKDEVLPNSLKKIQQLLKSQVF
ncbi:8-oxo-dGTP diphosphatase [Natronobacillus azotifigens]